MLDPVILHPFVVVDETIAEKGLHPGANSTPFAAIFSTIFAFTQYGEWVCTVLSHSKLDAIMLCGFAK